MITWVQKLIQTGLVLMFDACGVDYTCRGCGKQFPEEVYGAEAASKHQEHEAHCPDIKHN